MDLETNLEKWQIEYKKGFAKPLILKILSEKESYPYQITKLVKKRTEGRIEVATSNIYPILTRLVKEGLIEKKEDVEQNRIVYETSAIGKEFLAELSVELEKFLVQIKSILFN